MPEVEYVYYRWACTRCPSTRRTAAKIAPNCLACGRMMERAGIVRETVTTVSISTTGDVATVEEE